MTAVLEKDKVKTEEETLKNYFTKEEIEQMRQPFREPLRFLIEANNGKSNISAYRIRPEDGVKYCNKLSQELFEKYGDEQLTLRVLARISAREWKELGVAQRTKDILFDEDCFFIQEQSIE